MENYIGIDIGGSSVKAGLVRGTEIIYRTHIKTPVGEGEDAFFETIFDLIKEICGRCSLRPDDIKGIGIGIAGMVLADNGVLLSAANLGLENINFANEIQARYNVPVRIGNDVSCFALAQSKLGNINNLVYVALGTGINVGIINRGMLFRGSNGASIEYGHTQFTPDGAPCNCGLCGCVEQFVSGKAIKSACQNAGIFIAHPGEIFEKYDEDFGARKIVDNFISNLSAVIVNIANTYRPEAIFIGGGLANCVTPFLAQLRQKFKTQFYGYKNAPEIDLQISQISNDGGILGAAFMCQDL